jgi:hypothetical protein
MPQAHAPAATPDQGVRDLIALIDSLVVVIQSENADLAQGIPATRLRQVDEKSRLADLFEASIGRSGARSGRLLVQDRALREQLLQRVAGLRVAMDENVLRLRAAMEASNRRIDAVMQAIRLQIASAAPYGATGRHTSGGAASCRSSIQV